MLSGSDSYDCDDSDSFTDSRSSTSPSPLCSQWVTACCLSVCQLVLVQYSIPRMAAMIGPIASICISVFLVAISSLSTSLVLRYCRLVQAPSLVVALDVLIGRWAAVLAAASNAALNLLVATTLFTQQSEATFELFFSFLSPGIATESQRLLGLMPTLVTTIGLPWIQTHVRGSMWTIMARISCVALPLLIASGWIQSMSGYRALTQSQELQCFKTAWSRPTLWDRSAGSYAHAISDFTGALASLLMAPGQLPGNLSQGQPSRAIVPLSSGITCSLVLVSAVMGAAPYSCNPLIAPPYALSDIYSGIGVYTLLSRLLHVISCAVATPIFCAQLADSTALLIPGYRVAARTPPRTPRPTAMVVTHTAVQSFSSGTQKSSALLFTRSFIIPAIIASIGSVVFPLRFSPTVLLGIVGPLCAAIVGCGSVALLHICHCRRVFSLHASDWAQAVILSVLAVILVFSVFIPPISSSDR